MRLMLAGMTQKSMDAYKFQIGFRIQEHMTDTIRMTQYWYTSVGLNISMT